MCSRKTLNSYFMSVKKFPGLFQEFLNCFFSRPGNLMDHFLGFQGFPGCMGTLGERSRRYQEGIGSLAPAEKLE